MPAPRAPELPALRPAHLVRSGFFSPADPGAVWAGDVVLHRHVEDGDPARERFRLPEPLGYWDEHVGPVVVPADPATFSSDLTSVPRLLTWLVPTTGQHLPASLVHDGLVAAQGEPASYLARRPVDRVTADRVFRDAMRDLGVPWLRRELMWAGVSVATMLTGPPSRTWRAWVAVSVMAATIAVFGTLATVDLVDLAAPLPWMGRRPWWAEVLNGALAAVVVPLLLAATWGRRRRAGAVAGVGTALVFHATVAVVLVFSAFSAAENLLSRRFLPAAAWGALTGAVLAVAGAVVALAR
ncbi:hypothetical protein NUM3379_16120 [Kineococcus sp. NUM-3379]